MKRRWRRGRHQAPAEMNITAFMNLMVILVPFLLITAVFSRIAILQLNLPADAQGRPPEKPRLQLELILRRNAIEVAERGAAGVRVPRGEGGYDLARISALLRDIKARFPDKTDITLLLEPDIPYDDLVQVMDTVRVAAVTKGGRRVNAELFPDISIGDAPPDPIKQARR
ncbi:MAG TPA: biopolymer transporter ExbD [Gammaproteobacteria bacterium]|nr:biopolymer transporter ExbD [Gammaproteobacteria bacterium]